MSRFPVNYTHRIFSDHYFIEWLANIPENQSFEILRYLMHIRCSSLYYPGDHNIILESAKDYCLKNNLLTKDKIGGAFKKCEDPEYLIIHKDTINFVSLQT